MLLLCVSLYKDLNNDPMLLRHSLANQVLVDSVTTAVTTANEPHEVETIELHTSLSSTTDGDDAAGESCQDSTDEAAQDLGQFEHMDPGSSVDVRRVFTGKEINAHGGVLPTGATCETHRIRSHVTADRKRDSVAIDRHL